MSYTEVSRGEIIKAMEELKLKGMLESFDEVVSDIIRRKAYFLYGLQELLKAEVKSKKIRLLSKLHVRVSVIITTNLIFSR